MKPWVLLTLLMSTTAGAGCTTWATERHTVAQAATAEGLRYCEVLDALALVANNPGALPTYASVYTGTTKITDTGSPASTTVWAAKGFMQSTVHGFFSETAGSPSPNSPLANRTVIQNWALDPVVVPEKLEAIRCACQWVIYGPNAVCADCYGLLETPDQVPFPGRHFGVADRLAALPRGWLHIGKRADVPLGACFKWHCGHTWVWVMPDGLQGLADFALVIQDIARVYANSPTLFAIPPPTSQLRIVTQPPQGKDQNRWAVTAVVNLNPLHQLVAWAPYYPFRVDNVGADAHFASKINAAGVTP